MSFLLRLFGPSDPAKVAARAAAKQAAKTQELAKEVKYSKWIQEVAETSNQILKKHGLFITKREYIEFLGFSGRDGLYAYSDLVTFFDEDKKVPQVIIAGAIDPSKMNDYTQAIKEIEETTGYKIGKHLGEVITKDGAIRVGFKNTDEREYEYDVRFWS